MEVSVACQRQCRRIRTAVSGYTYPYSLIAYLVADYLPLASFFLFLFF
jgi:hypothetical protein